ncbi:minor capsid protein [Bacillus sp. SRB1LM]|uniref:minor capsid protein n=1 Tax=Bacillus sp. SRB1LM TaxID=2608688 RepID=UPI0018C3D47C|nr:minor capsid protein [Bacillus sp. SRB1LM]MBG0964166.1 minor capsid protein [Bacillus sp. SRB1LM]MBG0967219.1 minor capsid protein [Bacillus sp. SRB1LM]
MKWLVESVIKHLNKVLPPNIVYAPIKANVLDVGTNNAPRKSIALRIIPSAPGEQYFEGETIKKNFQILVKSPDGLEAMSSVEAIADELHNLHRRSFQSVDTSYKLITMEKYVEPNWVDKTEANEQIYTALFTTELEKGG